MSDLANIEVTSWWGRLLVGRRPRRTLVRLAIVVGLYFFLFKVVFIPIRVTGQSMEPTYRNGRINLVNRWSYARQSPQRGDVIGLQADTSHLFLLKRVVGLPGETVQIVRSGVVVDGEPLAEPYAAGKGIPGMRQPRTLGADEFFVAGDNRSVTEYGVVRLHEIKGKVVF
jgi:signal peptidase I